MPTHTRPSSTRNESQVIYPRASRFLRFSGAHILASPALTCLPLTFLTPARPTARSASRPRPFKHHRFSTGRAPAPTSRELLRQRLRHRGTRSADLRQHFPSVPFVFVFLRFLVGRKLLHHPSYIELLFNSSMISRLPSLSSAPFFFY